jgi:hypothetical protein
VVTIVNVALGFGAILLMLGTLRWRHHVRGVEEEMKGGPPPENGQPEGPPSHTPVAADRDRI